MTLRLKHPYCRIKQVREGKMDTIGQAVFCDANQCDCMEPQNGKLCFDCFCNGAIIK